MTVVFLGHREGMREAEERIYNVIQQLLKENEKVNFMVGNQGEFDRAVHHCLRRLKSEQPEIVCEIILAYLPKQCNEDIIQPDILPTVYPQGLENVPNRYTISKRNEWMLNQADTVVIYMNRNYGETARIYKKAKAKGLRIINLADG